MIAHASPIEHLGIIAAGCVAVAVYGRSWLRLPARHRSSSTLWMWCGGIVVLLAAVSPPVERLAADSFTGHMVQHQLMILVAAPLLVLARPVRTVGEGLAPGRRSARSERRLARWWRGAGPVVAPVAFVLVLFVTHLTGIYDAALRSRVVHDLEHVAYLAAAVALWAVVRASGRASAPARVVAVFAVIAGSALLGVILLTASVPLIDTYARAHGADAALRDQRAAASLMWVGGMALSLPLLIMSVWRWASAEQRAAERVEQLQARAVPGGALAAHRGRESGP